MNYEKRNIWNLKSSNMVEKKKRRKRNGMERLNKIEDVEDVVINNLHTFFRLPNRLDWEPEPTI